MGDNGGDEGGGETRGVKTMEAIRGSQEAGLRWVG